MPQLSFHTPIGMLTVSELDGAIVAVDWGWGRDQVETTVLTAARDQVQEYFDGLRTVFDVPITLGGSLYARQVLTAVLWLNYGQTMTYAELAAHSAGTAASVGRVLAGNPLPILVPSHRVLGKTSVGRFAEEAGGAATKRYLLALEARAGASPG